MKYKLPEDYIVDLKNYLNSEDIRTFQQEVKTVQNFCVIQDGQTKSQLRITPNGELIISAGYTWDGNSPKISFLGLFWIGTPDGQLYENNPITYYASLVHDALCQFKDCKDMPSIFRSPEGFDGWKNTGRDGRDKLYLKMLKEREFILAWSYYACLTICGPIYDWLSTSKEPKNKDSFLTQQ